MHNFNENFKILPYRKFIFLGVFVSRLNFLATHEFNLPEKPTHKKANTCIERKVYYAGVFCKISLYERLIGGLEGNRTPVRKPLDMTFSVGSQFLLFPTKCRQLTGNAQSVAPLCLIGSGATADASSPLR